MEFHPIHTLHMSQSTDVSNTLEVNTEGNLIEGKPEPLNKMSFIEVIEDCVRIYYRRITYDDGSDSSKAGFNFYVFEETAYNPEYKKPFDDPEVSGECIFQGTAYWDGMRHFYMGDRETENDGYLYYPDLEVLIKVLEKLRELELRFCKMDA